MVRRSSWKFGDYRIIIQLLILLGLTVVLPALGRAQEQPPNRAGVVIQHGDGRVTTACVSFTEPEITGLTLLDRAGISYLAQSGGVGAAVCKLDGEGCEYPTEDCFCRCKGADCVYWIYHHLRDGKWSYSQVGAGATVIRPGEVDGWVWGPGSLQAGAQPPALSFGEVCPAPSGDQQPAATEVAPTPTQPTQAPPPTPPPTAASAAPTPPPTLRPTRTAQLPAAATTSPSTAETVALPTAAESPTPIVASTTEIAVPTTSAQSTADQAPTAQVTAQPASAQLPTAIVGEYPAYIPPATAAPLPTQSPETITPTAQVTPTQGVDSGYLGFGILVLILVGGIVAILLRRRGRSG